MDVRPGPFGSRFATKLLDARGSVRMGRRRERKGVHEVSSHMSSQSMHLSIILLRTRMSEPASQVRSVLDCTRYR